MATPESEITVTSSSRNALHLGLLLPIVAGLGVGAVHGVGGIIAIFANYFVTSETDPVTSFPGQLVLFVAVPFFSPGLTSLILLLAGATGLLFHEKKPNPAPPSLPGTS
jgi:ABC-type dipeptide/oligopeptide/nickel transport system permease subunit